MTNLLFLLSLLGVILRPGVTGHQWLVLPPYLHPTQLGISAPLWPQAPVVQPEPLQPLQPEGVQPEGPPLPDGTSSSTGAEEEIVLSPQALGLLSMLEGPEEKGKAWPKIA